jgi:hypothetical protein
MCQTGCIGYVFYIGKRFGIGIGDARTVVLQAERDHFFRREVIMVCLLWRGLGDIMVLTVQASEVTACTGDGETGGTWMEMIQRFLLHRINGQGTRLTIDLTHKPAIMIPPTATDTSLPLTYMTMVGTDLTLHSPTL